MRPLHIGAFLALVGFMWLSTIVDLYYVVGDSMLPNLRHGDILACVDVGNIRRTDIVVFADARNDIIGVKRVIGVPQDHIRYASDKTLAINGNVAPKINSKGLGTEALGDLVTDQTIFGRQFSIYEDYGRSQAVSDIVLEDGYFLLGDNRDHSTDSRQLGAVSRASIRCRSVAVLGVGS